MILYLISQIFCSQVHVIFSYKGKNHLIKKDIRCKDDVYTHLYTLIVKPDNTYEVLIDNEKVESGELEADWDFLPPKKIKVNNVRLFKLILSNQSINVKSQTNQHIHLCQSSRRPVRLFKANK